ncbi:hypothetical protein OSB04_010888 [Centaurea solstitialis]|uniref:Uncharacterized protein n=1 Tax=Centaurea solstitialis TaxID=347529 RepID=A0AA38T8F1_9ASTR|nr:hypothetical protein OSB04_010888 [Centaurea solstitialis]
MQTETGTFSLSPPPATYSGDHVTTFTSGNLLCYNFVGAGIESDVEKLTEDYNMMVVNMADVRALAATEYGMRELQMQDCGRSREGLLETVAGVGMVVDGSLMLPCSPMVHKLECSHHHLHAGQLHRRRPPPPALACRPPPPSSPADLQPLPVTAETDRRRLACIKPSPLAPGNSPPPSPANQPSPFVAETDRRRRLLTHHRCCRNRPPPPPPVP